MKNKPLIIVIFLLLLNQTSIITISQCKNSEIKTIEYDNENSLKENYKILFIGSSYFNFNNLPYLFESLSLDSGIEVTVHQRIPNGWYLENHANSNETEIKINEQEWDYVILQGAGSNTAYPDYFTDHPVLPALKILKDKIYKNCKSTKILFCLPWAFEDGMTWYENWTDTYKDMQIKILNNTLKFCNETELQIAPVGWSWYTVLEEMNYPLHYLHKSDWNHPSRKGSYLMACVIYSSLFLKSCVGNPYNGSLNNEEALYFQNIASKTVFDNLSLWNLVYENDTTPPYIKIIYPTNGLYFNNEKILNLTNNIISIKSINIIVKASDIESGIDYIEYEIVKFPFFIIGVFDDNNYSYTLDKFSIGIWHVTVRAYDNSGNKAIDQIKIWKLL